MAANSEYRVTYHWEKGGKRASETLQANVIAADQGSTTIFNVLNTNSKVPTGLTAANLAIEAIGNVGGASNVLS